MAKVGYIRVSTVGQHEDRQLESFTAEGGFDKIFLDKCSGKNLDRPQFKAMMEYLREGDTLVVDSYSRLSRSVSDLLNTVDELNKKGVTLVSKKEGIDTGTPTGRLFLTITAGLSQFERECMLERQKEGIACAKEKGVYKGRKPIEKPKKADEIFELVADGRITATRGMEVLGLKRDCFYNFYREYKEAHRA